jgi:hypothetical protein
MKQNNHSIWDWLGFIFGCTVCTVILVYIIGGLILRIPTTPDNVQIRLSFVDLVKYLSGVITGIISMKVVGTTPNKKQDNDTTKNE